MNLREDGKIFHILCIPIDQGRNTINPSGRGSIGGDIQASKKVDIPGIATNNRGVVFYNGNGRTAHIPISFFQMLRAK